ncbi:hypothetical protein B0I35DRAFT_448600 [Stachybotrys elegans]|uniref:DUF1993 domain-containing protein n=1 Tax=Stachybotrys elegans TaxID=80388 RepID=A0A8K0T646_9HYPO|nr:hypothetical protein B0I35DRAFT_448600 [Stachybotrys elegans]
MPSNIYLQLVPAWIRFLNNLSHFLDEGLKFAQEKGITEEELLTYKLADDMKGLRYRVQGTCDTIKFSLKRVGLLDEVPVDPDTEVTVQDLKGRIQKVLDLLNSVDPEAAAGRESEPLIMTTKFAGDLPFDTAQRYISEYALPWTHFHLTTAYGIMRNLGVPLGAGDYLKDVFPTLQETLKPAAK